jgi:hypothetical protein
MSIKLRIGLLAVLILLAAGGGAFYLFNRLYQNDMNTLVEFSAAYDQYDQAVSNFSNPGAVPDGAGLAQKADQALAELKSRAAISLSSMIKHEKEVMGAMLEVADLSGKELDTLKAYRSAVIAKAGDADQLRQAFQDLTRQRQAAFGRFQNYGKD